MTQLEIQQMFWRQIHKSGLDTTTIRKRVLEYLHENCDLQDLVEDFASQFGEEADEGIILEEIKEITD